MLRDLPTAEKRTVVAACRSDTRAFVDLLGEEYLRASRVDREQGVAVAELAVLVVEINAVELGQAAADLLALAWTWVAIARRLTSDYPAAEAAIREAEISWDEPRPRVDRAVRAEILLTKGNLRYSQRRFEEAVELLNEAIKESRLAHAPRLLAQALILRASVIDYGRLGLPVLPDLRQALRVLRTLDEPRLTFIAQMNLAHAHQTAEHFRLALEEVVAAWALWKTP